MSTSHWVKAGPPYLDNKYLNGGTGQATLGGALSSVPSGVSGASQAQQSRPGDRVMLSGVDALALSDTDVGTLYEGMYQFGQAVSGSVATATLARRMFWDTAESDSEYAFTPDEDAGATVNLPQGIAITATITAGYYWWIQISGKVDWHARASITGTAAAGAAVFDAAVGAGDPGVFDVLDTFADAAGLPQANRLAGTAIELPVNNTTTQVWLDLRLKRY